MENNIKFYTPKKDFLMNANELDYRDVYVSKCELADKDLYYIGNLFTYVKVYDYINSCVVNIIVSNSQYSKLEIGSRYTVLEVSETTYLNEAIKIGESYQILDKYSRYELKDDIVYFAVFDLKEDVIKNEDPKPVKDKSNLYETEFVNYKKILIVDLDDTMSNLLDNWLAQYSDKVGVNFYEDEIKHWDLTKHASIKSDIFDLLHDPSVYLGAKPKDGCIEALKILQHRYDIYVVSSCNEDAFKAKAQWLQFYFPFIPIQHFIACTPKQLIKGDVMIDDRPENLYGFEGKRLLMARTFNQPENYGSYKKEIFMVDNWGQIIDTLLNNCNIL